MRLLIYSLLAWSLQAQSQSLDTPATTRSVYLNGVDISSAKNQALQQVNVRIDAQGHVYIEAPHYDIQRETSFLPLGRQLPGQPRHLEHKPPTALNHSPSVPLGSDSKPNLAPAPETSDTWKQGAASQNPGNATPGRKEGTRTPPDGSEERAIPSTEAPTNPG